MPERPPHAHLRNARSSWTCANDPSGMPDTRLTLFTFRTRSFASGSGTAARAQIRVILRDFDDRRLDEHLAMLRAIAQDVVGSAPRARLISAVRSISWASRVARQRQSRSSADSDVA